MDANSWTLIIGAVFLGLAKLLSMWLEYKRDLAKVARDKDVAGKVALVADAAVDASEKVAEVKDTLATHSNEVNKALGSLAETANETYKIVNSQRTQMVERIDGLQGEVNDLKQAARDKENKG